MYVAHIRYKGTISGGGKGNWAEGKIHSKVQRLALGYCKTMNIKSICCGYFLSFRITSDIGMLLRNNRVWAETQEVEESLSHPPQIVQLGQTHRRAPQNNSFTR